MEQTQKHDPCKPWEVVRYVLFFKSIYFFRNYFKGHMDQIKAEGGGGGGRRVQLGWGGGMWRKGTTVTE